MSWPSEEGDKGSATRRLLYAVERYKRPVGGDKISALLLFEIIEVRGRVTTDSLPVIQIREPHYCRRREKYSTVSYFSGRVQHRLFDGGDR
jgi:hypothetical protein